MLRAIRSVTKNITKGLINLGELGELTGRLIIQKAMDSAVMRSKVSRASKINTGINFSGFVTVSEFLQELIGETRLNEFKDAYKSKNNLAGFLNAYVCFNHFIQSHEKRESRMTEATGEIRKRELLEYAKRLGAMICEPGHPITDAEIPVFFADGLDDGELR